MARTDADYPSATAFMPPKLSLPALREAAAGCQGCPLFKTGTQTVFGEGPASARAIFIGEQPGDMEDRSGLPFVGRAGRLLDELMEEAGIDRSKVYVTNAVKHFKWVARGKRRLHAKPTSREMAACKPWLEAELGVVKPDVVVCLGATAAQDLLGPDFRITRDRGRVFRDTAYALALLATLHPSAVLRVPTPEAREAARAGLLADLRVVHRLMEEAAARPAG